MVTVIRNGEYEKIPSFPALEEVRQDPDGSVYLSMELKNCAGTNWRREIFRIPEVGLVVQDTVTAWDEGCLLYTSRVLHPTGRGSFFAGCGEDLGLSLIHIFILLLLSCYTITRNFSSCSPTDRPPW